MGKPGLSQSAKPPSLASPSWGSPPSHDEEWKYTNVAPITRIPFQPAKRLAPGLAAEALAAATIPGLVSAQLVCVNGHFVPELSALHALPNGVEVGSFAQALATRPFGLEAHLARYAGFEEQAFVALNTAFLQDGASSTCRVVASSTRPSTSFSSPCRRGTPQFRIPAICLVFQESTQATMVESYIGLGQDVYFTNAVTESFRAQHAVWNTVGWTRRARVRSTSPRCRSSKRATAIVCRMPSR